MAVFRVEKTKDFTIMSNFHLRDVELSLKAKGLLSLMLSLPEDWDYTTKGLACICRDGVDSITSALKELENHGYLTRQRIRYGNGRLGDITYTIHERPVIQEAKEEKEEQPEQGEPERENPRQVNPGQVNLKQAEPEQESTAQLNTKQSNTDGLNTYQSIYPEEPGAVCCQGRTDGIDRMELADAYREIICENIEYSILAERHGKQRMDETVELMLEVILSKRPYIRIAGDDFPREVVRSRFLKINSSHVEYVFDCIDNNTTKVGNIKAYLLTALYNAPATMGSYYRAEVNHDLYGT
ncbi:MAG: helix-turn-helix domain-containing protein [Lachnospiraceae bacterium]|nr:helix-turn-helix domain-containing protein [Lachnospiraceae bacterium]